jgi:hypothetical protein
MFDKGPAAHLSAQNKTKFGWTARAVLPPRSVPRLNAD